MSNRLGLRQLRAFHAVMTSGSVTAAAERLNLTQPAISKQLSALEDAVGLTLFHRKSGRAATPTRAGVEFFHAVEPTMVGLDDIDAIAKTIGERGQSQLRIAATPPLINSAPLMHALGRYVTAFPSSRFSLEPRHRLEIEDWVASRRIDLALALLPVENPALQTVPLVETEAVAVLSQHHRLGTCKALSPDDLVDETVILPSRQPLRTRIDAALEVKHHGLEPQFEATSTITTTRLAASGLGVAICDPFSPTAFGDDLKVLPWTPRVPLTYGALYHRAYGLDGKVEMLLELLRNAFSKMSQRDGGEHWAEPARNR